MGHSIHMGRSGGIVSPFDGPSRHAEAKRQADGSGVVAQADLEMLRKLLTTDVPEGRCGEDHIAYRFECGHPTTIPQRLAVLGAEMP